MFTGIIEEIGVIQRVNSIPGGLKFTIGCKKILDDLKIDDSVSVNGVCLTSIRVDNDSFDCEAVGETLNKTTINTLTVNIKVNLERAVCLAERLGGHLVQGHVNGAGIITKIVKLGDNYLLALKIPNELKKYVVDEGSIAIDGISLTVAKIINDEVEISVIPHTWANTNLSHKEPGNKVNIETDILAKYVEKILSEKNNSINTGESWVNKLGYQ